MHYESNHVAILIFVFFVAFVLGLSFFLGRKKQSARGYYAAHGQIHWFVNGVAFAGDYLSAASFLGICGMIAFFGYDGFLSAEAFPDPNPKAAAQQTMLTYRRYVAGGPVGV